MTNNFPVDKCDEILQTNDQLKECNRLGVIKLSDFIQACHIDYQVPWEISYNLKRYVLLVFSLKATKSDIWPFIYLEELKSKCRFIVKNDKTFWTKQTEPNELLDKLCPLDCNQNGQCVSGVCKCNSGFAHFDCSIDLNKKPLLFELNSSNMCDVRKLSNCSKLLLHGENFSDEMEIKLTIFDLFKVILICNQILNESIF